MARIRLLFQKVDKTIKITLIIVTKCTHIDRSNLEGIERKHRDREKKQPQTTVVNYILSDQLAVPRYHYNSHSQTHVHTHNYIENRSIIIRMKWLQWRSCNYQFTDFPYQITSHFLFHQPFQFAVLFISSFFSLLFNSIDLVLFYTPNRHIPNTKTDCIIRTIFLPRLIPIMWLKTRFFALNLIPPDLFVSRCYGFECWVWVWMCVAIILTFWFWLTISPEKKSTVKMELSVIHVIQACSHKLIRLPS